MARPRGAKERPTTPGRRGSRHLSPPRRPRGEGLFGYSGRSVGSFGRVVEQRVRGCVVGPEEWGSRREARREALASRGEQRCRRDREDGAEIGRRLDPREDVMNGSRDDGERQQPATHREQPLAGQPPATSSLRLLLSPHRTPAPSNAEKKCFVFITSRLLQKKVLFPPKPSSPPTPPQNGASPRSQAASLYPLPPPTVRARLVAHNRNRRLNRSRRRCCRGRNNRCRRARRRCLPSSSSRTRRRRLGPTTLPPRRPPSPPAPRKLSSTPRPRATTVLRAPPSSPGVVASAPSPLPSSPPSPPSTRTRRAPRVRLAAGTLPGAGGGWGRRVVLGALLTEVPVRRLARELVVPSVVVVVRVRSRRRRVRRMDDGGRSSRDDRDRTRDDWLSRLRALDGGNDGRRRYSSLAVLGNPVPRSSPPTPRLAPLRALVEPSGVALSRPGRRAGVRVVVVGARTALRSSDVVRVPRGEAGGGGRSGGRGGCWGGGGGSDSGGCGRESGTRGGGWGGVGAGSSVVGVRAVGKVEAFESAASVGERRGRGWGGDRNTNLGTSSRSLHDRHGCRARGCRTRRREGSYTSATHQHHT